jgi:hypothetical protein
MRAPSVEPDTRLPLYCICISLIYEHTGTRLPRIADWCRTEAKKRRTRASSIASSTKRYQDQGASVYICISEYTVYTHARTHTHTHTQAKTKERTSFYGKQKREDNSGAYGGEVGVVSFSLV